MERRVTADRRQAHLFVANDRRTGPFDRRETDSRRREWATQQAKIARIRTYKQKSRPSSPDQPLFTTKRLVMIGAAGLILILAWLLLG